MTGRLMRRPKRHPEARRAFDQARALASAVAERLPDDALRACFLRGIDETIPARVEPTARQASKAAFDGLTLREREVATLIAQGKANRAIARTLDIGERTVEGYVAAALSKLGFTSRAQLAAWAVEKGLKLH